MSEENKETTPTPEQMVLPEPGSLVLSTSPHVQDGESISGIMLKVIICLLPVIAASICVFGLKAVQILLICTATAMVWEYLCNLAARQKQTVTDWSAAVTGIILALNLPPSTPWWVCVTGTFIAIVIAKQVFGGLGQNPFNPAAVARVALLVGFAGYMSSEAVWSPAGEATEFTTGATPLTAVKMASGTADAVNTFEFWESKESLLNLFVGRVGGSLGETSALAILLGGIGLLLCRLIRWQIPVAMLGTTALFTWIVNLIDPTLTPGPLFHLLTGGMMIGAFFMATDMVTCPMTKLGAFVFGAAIGLISCIIRIWGGYPEGVSFAIVIMNALVPLIDRVCYKRPFGWTSTSASALQMRRGEVK